MYASGSGRGYGRGLLAAEQHPNMCLPQSQAKEGPCLCLKRRLDAPSRASLRPAMRIVEDRDVQLILHLLDIHRPIAEAALIVPACVRNDGAASKVSAAHDAAGLSWSLWECTLETRTTAPDAP